MRSLIIGGSGFAGGFLTEYLMATTDVDVADLKLGFDIRDYENVRRVIDELRPDYIYNLAAVTSIPEAIADPQRCIDTNLTGTLNILEAVRRLGLKTNILLASSTEAPTANNPYGTTKLAMEGLGDFYAKAHGLHVVSTRTCNHTGPGQEATFAVPNFARQVALVEAEAQDELVHGDLEVYKNYLDVRDVVVAYRLAIGLPSGTYTISSQEPVKMDTIVQLLKQAARMDIPSRVDERLLRPYVQPKTQHRTSEELAALWQPKHSLESTIVATLEYWRERIV